VVRQNDLWLPRAQVRHSLPLNAMRSSAGSTAHDLASL
jgi:hypothetical protein